MLFHAKKRRFEAIHVVAGRAFAFIGALEELALVGILMAIRALLEGDRLFEIPAGVALITAHRGMFAPQRKFCARVVKALAHRGRRHPLPPAGVVTGLAAG